MKEYYGFVYLVKLQKQWKSKLSGSREQGLAALENAVKEIKRCDYRNDCDECCAVCCCQRKWDLYCGCPVLTNTFIGTGTC